MRLFSGILVTTATMLLATGTAQAGHMIIFCDDNTRVGVGVAYKDGTSIGIGKDDTGNGRVDIFVPNQENIASLSVAKFSDGEFLLFEQKLNPNGVTFASLEPFELPSFTSLASASYLSALIDIEAFLTQGNPFTTGQPLNVVNGMTAQTTAITFKVNASANPLDPVASALQLLNPSFSDSLPAYSGPALVGPNDQFLPVPEPSSMMLFATGLMAVAVTRIRRRSKGAKAGCLKP